MRLIQILPPLALSTLLIASCNPFAPPENRDRVYLSNFQNEARFETSGSLSFVKKGSKVIATVHPKGGLQATSVEWPKRATSFSSIDTSKLFRLEYLEARSEGSYVGISLLRIWDHERLLYDASACSIHGLAMTRQSEETVSVEGYDNYYFTTFRPKSCPNDGKAYLACDSGFRHLRWRCPKCYQISEKW